MDEKDLLEALRHLRNIAEPDTRFKEQLRERLMQRVRASQAQPQQVKRPPAVSPLPVLFRLTGAAAVLVIMALAAFLVLLPRPRPGRIADVVSPGASPTPPPIPTALVEEQPSPPLQVQVSEQPTSTNSASASTDQSPEPPDTSGQASEARLIFVVASDADRLEDFRDESELAAGEAVAVEEGEDYAVEEGSTAVLLLSDGSQVNVGGGSTFIVDDLHTEPDLPYSVKIGLRVGQLFARVNRLLGSTDSFEIETPSSTSLVHGTAYGVEVVAEDASYFYTTEGQVAVTLGDQAVEVHAGEETLAQVGEDLKVHPRGQGLADQFSVPYVEIIGRFEEGYGFGQIKQVYEQSEATGIPAEDLFALFETGLSIGGIKRAVDLVSDYDITLDEVVARLEAGEKLNDIIRDVSGPPGNSGNRP